MNRGEKSIPVLSKHQNGVAHLFDISQLQGNPNPWIWKITDKNRGVFVTQFINKNIKYANQYYQSFKEIRENMILEQWRNVVGKTLEKSEIRKTLMSEFFIQSVEYMVQYRCNCLTEEADHIYFSQIPVEINATTIHTLGYYTVKIARDLLLNSKEIVMEMRKKEIEYERRQKNRGTTQRDENGIRGEGRSLVRSSGSGGEQGVLQTTEQIRQPGNEVLGGGETSGTSNVNHRGNHDGDDAQDSEKSGGDVGKTSGRNAPKGTLQESKRYHGNLSAQTEDTRPSGRDYAPGSNIQLELDFNKLNKEIEMEEGVDKAASFFVQRSYGQKKISDILLEEAIYHGSGTVGGKGRIFNLFRKEVSEKEKINLLKSEYGYYGFRAGQKKIGLNGLESTPVTGIKIQWTQANGKEEEILSWKQVGKVISRMITEERYHDITLINKAENKKIAELEQNEEKEELVEPKGNVNNISLPAKKINYQYDSSHVREGGIKTKYQDNIVAIKTLRTIEAENRLANAEEHILLSRYIGWGGMAGAFDEKNNTWANEYAELKSLLSEDEYKSARASTTTAFYTSPVIIQEIYTALGQFGFQGGNILEPSMGIGNFFSHIPKQLLSKSRLYGVELDRLSGRIAKQLYQNADIQVCGYEHANLSDNFFDVAIGNVPFGDYKVFDSRYKKHNFHIHDYFFSKTIDKVRAGGMIAFITSKGTLDKANPVIRKYIAERTDFIGAIRLPNTAFKDANTEVTSDIIFLQKRERMQVSEPSWVYTGLTEDKIPINQYFVEHPKMMLGKLVYDTRMFGEESKYTTVISEHPDTFSKDLKKAIESLSAQMKVTSNQNQEEEIEKNTIPADPNVKNFCYADVDGDIYYRENSIMTKIEFMKKKQEQMKALIQLRSAAREIISAQLDNCSQKELSLFQERLNKHYDSFVKKYEVLSAKSNAIFKLDADYPLLLSLEHRDKDNKIVKADIFNKRTINPYKVIDHVDTPREGLAVSVTEKGKVDLAFIARLSGCTKDEVLDELKGEIFFNPENTKKKILMQGMKVQRSICAAMFGQSLRLQPFLLNQTLSFT